MSEDQLQLVRYMQVASAFSLVLSVWLAGVLLWSTRRAARSRVLQQRMGLAPLDPHGDGRVLRLWHDGREAITIVRGFTVEGGLKTQLETLLRQADWRTPLSTALLGLAGVLAVVFVIIFMITQNAIIGVCGSLAALIVFWIFLRQRIARRTSIFERQLIDALELASRSLRAGHPLARAFRLIADEIPAPVGELFGRVWQQQQLGQSLDEALRQEADQSGSEDTKLFATSVRIQLRSGGNLADLMQRLADVIRERNRLSRRVRVLTAQTQFSKRILLAMPFLMFVLMNVINPGYLAPLYVTYAGHVILAFSAATLLFGWWVMNRMARLSW